MCYSQEFVVFSEEENRKESCSKSTQPFGLEKGTHGKPTSPSGLIRATALKCGNLLGIERHIKQEAAASGIHRVLSRLHPSCPWNAANAGNAHLNTAAMATPTPQSKSFHYRDNRASITWHIVGGKIACGENTFFSTIKAANYFSYSTQYRETHTF